MVFDAENYSLTLIYYSFFLWSNVRYNNNNLKTFAHCVSYLFHMIEQFHFILTTIILSSLHERDV